MSKDQKVHIWGCKQTGYLTRGGGGGGGGGGVLISLYPLPRLENLTLSIYCSFELLSDPSFGVYVFFITLTSFSAFMPVIPEFLTAEQRLILETCFILGRLNAHSFESINHYNRPSVILKAFFYTNACSLIRMCRAV